MYPLPRLRLDDEHRAPAHGTFNWLLCPQDPDGLPAHEFQACCYTDGSRIHNRHPDTLRLGWAFAAVNPDGFVIAAASGVPPWYITDVPGAEAWAILQAAAHALPGSSFRSDCKPCVDFISSGRAVACSARRPLARVFNRIFDLFEWRGFGHEDVAWMPAHTSARDVGVLRLSNGSLLSDIDRSANALADSQAKLAAARFAVPSEVLCALDTFATQAKAALRLLGTVTWAATHYGPGGARDSEASRARANAARPAARTAYTGAGAHTATRGPSRHSSDLSLRKKVCRWILKANEAPGAGTAGSTPGLHTSHRLFRSGDVVWCARCGVYSATRGMGLARPCTGPVPVAAVGGRAQQLRQLIKGRHPKLHHRLLPAVPFDPALGTESTADAGALSMRTDDAAILSRTAAGRRQLRVRRREFIRRTGVTPDVDVGLADSAMRAAAPSAVVKRRAELVRLLLEAAAGPADSSGSRPAKRPRACPSAEPSSPATRRQLRPPTAVEEGTEAAVRPPSPETSPGPPREPSATPTIVLATSGAADGPAAPPCAMPANACASDAPAAARDPHVPSLRKRPIGTAADSAAKRRRARPQQAALDAAGHSAQRSGSARLPLRAVSEAAVRPPSPPQVLPAAPSADSATHGRRRAGAPPRRAHPALCRSRLAPLPAEPISLSAPAASSGRADSRWGRCGSEHTGLDGGSDDAAAGPLRERAPWRPLRLRRRGTKRAGSPSSAALADHPRSPLGARGQRRRAG